MNAAVRTSGGIKFEGQVPLPKEKATGQVLLKVRAAAINPVDYKLPKWLAGPVAGIDVAGVVQSVSPDVTQYKPGDEVFGFASGGSLAQYAVADADKLAPKPEDVPFSVAAALPTAHLTSYQALLEHGVRTIVSSSHRLRCVEGRRRDENEDGRPSMHKVKLFYILIHCFTVYCTKYADKTIEYSYSIGGFFFWTGTLPPGSERGRPCADHRRERGLRVIGVPAGIGDGCLRGGGRLQRRQRTTRTKSGGDSMRRLQRSISHGRAGR